MDLLDPLVRRRLIIVTGKGGVGKSAMTASLGRLLAEHGRRTLVLEVDARENLHQLFDVPPSGGEITSVADRLYLQNLKPQAVVDWVVRKQVKIEMVVQKVLASPVYHRFVEGAPGLEQMAILGHALRLVRGDDRRAPKIDTVVLDAPATGHGLYLVTASRLYAETIAKGPIADLAREVAEFTESEDETAVVIVTLAEEMPVQEALEMRESLVEIFGREPELLVVNGVYPALPESAEQEPRSADEQELAELWRQRREVNERELERVAREWPGRWVELPLLAVDRGPDLVDHLTPRLGEAPIRDGAEKGEAR